jgi:hypothetical protein
MYSSNHLDPKQSIKPYMCKRKMTKRYTNTYIPTINRMKEQPHKSVPLPKTRQLQPKSKRPVAGKSIKPPITHENKPQNTIPFYHQTGKATQYTRTVPPKNASISTHHFRLHSTQSLPPPPPHAPQIRHVVESMALISKPIFLITRQKKHI